MCLAYFTTCYDLSSSQRNTIKQSRKLLWLPCQSNVDCSAMMIDDDTLKQLLRINDELMQLCKTAGWGSDVIFAIRENLRVSGI